MTTLLHATLNERERMEVETVKEWSDSLGAETDSVGLQFSPRVELLS